MLGPGYQPDGEGVGLIYWNCKDGSILKVWPYECKLDKKPKYWIDVRGTNQKHDIIKKMANDFIKGIEVVGEKVIIVLKKDMCLIKAGKPRYYKVGDCLQKVDPLPRIDFTIRKINSNIIPCDYFYQA